MLAEIVPFDGVPELLTELRSRGMKVVLASSGAPDQVDAYLELFDGRRLADAWTTLGTPQRRRLVHRFAAGLVAAHEVLRLVRRSPDGSPSRLRVVGDLLLHDTFDVDAVAGPHDTITFAELRHRLRSTQGSTTDVFPSWRYL
jgi:hypothetical protein